MIGPLSGFRVVDLSTTMSGPLATKILAEFGAEVIKIEAPGGDVLRKVGPGRCGMSGYFANINHGKRSIVVDLQTTEGRALVRRLASTADVFVHNMRTGAAERWGVSADDLCEANPRLIYASITGFGSTTSRASDPAYDQILQALSGIAARQGPPGGPPELIRQSVVDKSTAYATAQAITSALLHRERSGQGSVVEIPMLDVAINFVWPDGMANYTCLENDISSYGDVANSFRLTETADGYLSLNTITNRQFLALMGAVGMEPDERLNTVEGRGKYGGEIMREARRRLGELTTAEAIARLRKAEVPCAPVVALSEVRNTPEVVESGVLREIDHPVLGAMLAPRPATRMAGVDPLDDRPAPALGQDTDDVLIELGYQREEMESLRRRRIVG